MNTNSDINATLACEPYHGQKLNLSACGVKRTIRRTGICIEGEYYYAPEMMAHLGETVLVKVSPDGFEAMYFSLEGKFLGVGRCEEARNALASLSALSFRKIQRNYSL